MSDKETIGDRMSALDGIEVREPTVEEIAHLFGLRVDDRAAFQRLAAENTLAPIFLRVLRQANLVA